MLSRNGIDDVALADGAFYVYADVRRFTDRIGGDSMALCRRWLTEIGVASTPGLDFDLRRGQHTVRFSYAGRAEDVGRACERIIEWTGGPA